MASMSDRADKDVQQHNAEMKEMIRVVDRDRRLREFMNAKSKERHEDQQLVAWRLRKGLFPLLVAWSSGERWSSAVELGLWPMCFRCPALDL